MSFNPDQERDEGGRWAGGGGDDRGGESNYKAVGIKTKVAYSGSDAGVINKYVDTDFLDVNHELRTRGGQFNKLSSDIKGIVSQLDSAIAKGSLAEDLVAYRGLGPEVELKVGEAFVDEGFISITTDPGIAKDFSHGGQIVRIEVPKFSRALKVTDATGPAGSTGEGEREIILSRGTVFDVSKDSSGVVTLKARLR
jgi:hypothetical protein